jgi:N-acyl-D-amino-acid deacylase
MPGTPHLTRRPRPAGRVRSPARRAVARGIAFLLLTASLAGADETRVFDVVIRRGTVYDGLGGPPRAADVGLRGDRIDAVGDLSAAPARAVVDAAGLAVAPGFVNMLSWATDDLLADPRSQGDIRQGVTTEVFGEGESYGPWSEPMKVRRRAMQGDIKYEIAWTTLAEYLRLLERRGVAPNVASFVGTGTIREHVVGLDDGRPTAAQLDEMRELVRRAMQEGALGVGSSLIYAPDSFNSREDLVELAKVAASYGGRYITHMRSEGEGLLESVDETIGVARAAGIPAEIYHLKAAGEANWAKLEGVIEKVEAARREGLEVTADMYTYTAAATGFDACLPPWSREGGWGRTLERIRDGEARARMLREMRAPAEGWENVCRLAGAPERVLLVAFRSEPLKPLAGKTLAEVAAARGRSPEETILDLVLEDDSRVGVVFFMMSEENVRRQIGLPWVAFGSDAGSMAPEGVFLKSSTHPRAYGNFARLLGRYVRDEKLVPLEEAIRRLTSFPAENLGLERRGRLAEGYFADVVVFDPATVADRATYETPHQFAVGVRHVLVNGVAVLRDGEHTGALPGRALLRGAPGGWDAPPVEKPVRRLDSLSLRGAPGGWDAPPVGKPVRSPDSLLSANPVRKPSPPPPVGKPAPSSWPVRSPSSSPPPTKGLQ